MRILPRIHPADITDRVAYAANMCLHDFAAFGACIRVSGHSGAHRDANGYGWQAEDTPMPEVSRTMVLSLRHIVRVAVDMFYATDETARTCAVDMLVDLLSLDGDAATREVVAAILDAVDCGEHTLDDAVHAFANLTERAQVERAARRF